MKFKLKIEPAISPKTRHKIQDVLQEAGYEIIGGGAATDGSFSDISFERDDPRDKEG
jgi:hypothetical protein